MIRSARWMRLKRATVHTFTVDLADMDRGVYERLELRVARHPAESADFLGARLLAYCLEYTDGIAFSQGIAAGDEPAVWVKDPTGRLIAWIELGLPAAERLHRGSKLAERTAVYTHRDVTQLLAQLKGLEGSATRPDLSPEESGAWWCNKDMMPQLPEPGSGPGR